MTYDLNALKDALAKMTPGECVYAGGFIVTRDDSLIICAPETAQDAAGLVALKNAAPALIADHLALQARVAELEAEVAEWRECMQFDALMSGPVFMGWDRSQMERCRKKYEARRTTEQKP